MERHTIIRPFMSLLLALGLILALAACGTVLDPDQLLQEEQEIVETDPGTGEPVGDDPAGEQPGEGEGEPGEGEPGEGEPGEGEPGEGEPGEGEPGEGEPGEDDEFGPGDETYDEDPTINGEPADQETMPGLLEPGAVLEGDFSGWNFDGLDMSGVIMRGAKFDDASFVGTQLNGANLRYGSFVGANFTNARLQGAKGAFADFREAIFTDAEMPADSFETEGALFDGATWEDGTTCGEGSVGGCKLP